MADYSRVQLIAYSRIASTKKWKIVKLDLHSCIRFPSAFFKDCFIGLLRPFGSGYKRSIPEKFIIFKFFEFLTKSIVSFVFSFS